MWSCSSFANMNWEERKGRNCGVSRSGREAVVPRKAEGCGEAHLEDGVGIRDGPEIERGVLRVEHLAERQLESVDLAVDGLRGVPQVGDMQRHEAAPSLALLRVVRIAPFFHRLFFPLASAASGAAGVVRLEFAERVIQSVLVACRLWLLLLLLRLLLLLDVVLEIPGHALHHGCHLRRVPRVGRVSLLNLHCWDSGRQLGCVGLALWAGIEKPRTLLLDAHNGLHPLQQFLCIPRKGSIVRS